MIFILKKSFNGEVAARKDSVLKLEAYRFYEKGWLQES